MRTWVFEKGDLKCSIDGISCPGTEILWDGRNPAPIICRVLYTGGAGFLPSQKIHAYRFPKLKQDRIPIFQKTAQKNLILTYPHHFCHLSLWILCLNHAIQAKINHQPTIKLVVSIQPNPSEKTSARQIGSFPPKYRAKNNKKLLWNHTQISKLSSSVYCIDWITKNLLQKMSSNHQPSPCYHVTTCHPPSLPHHVTVSPSRWPVDPRPPRLSWRRRRSCCVAAGWPAASVEDSERRKAAAPSPWRAGVAIEKKILSSINLPSIKTSLVFQKYPWKSSRCFGGKV